VFGGLYHLKRAAEALIITDKRDSVATCRGIVSRGQRLESSHLVLGFNHAPPQFLKAPSPGGLSRGILITDRYNKVIFTTTPNRLSTGNTLDLLLGHDLI
jgi:hypothetical protein